MLSQNIKRAKTVVHENDHKDSQKWYSEDDLIEAWEMGKKHLKNKVIKELETNIQLAQKISEGFIERIYL